MTDIKVCPLCQKQVQFKLLDKHLDKGQQYKLYECQDCGAQFWLPLKNPGSEWYQQDERYAGRNIDPILEPNWNHKKIISFLKDKPGKVLDIGCGVGTFLKYARDNDWRIYGFDFDSDAIKAAKETFGLDNLEVCDIEEYYHNHSQDKFDLITFFDVFEHIDNHNEFIAMVKEMLNSGGYIAMSMPYRKGAAWLKPHDLPPRHLTRWDRATIARFLERNGFRLLYNYRKSEGPGYIVLKLRFKYGRLFSFNLVGRAKQKSLVSGNRGMAIKNRSVSYWQLLATFKDWVIFGVPAIIIWLIMLLSAKRYITLYVIAKKID